jgi:hypothetical protein
MRQKEREREREREREKAPAVASGFFFFFFFCIPIIRRGTTGAVMGRAGSVAGNRVGILCWHSVLTLS